MDNYKYSTQCAGGAGNVLEKFGSQTRIIVDLSLATPMIYVTW